MVAVARELALAGMAVELAPQRARAHFSPVAAGTIELTVQATGVNAPENLYVASADAGTARSGSLTLEVKQGERCSVTVTFDEPYDGPIELIAVTQSETTEVPA